MTLARLSVLLTPLLAAGLLAGCVAPLPLAETSVPPPPPPPPVEQAPVPAAFRAADFAWSQALGRATIAGRLAFGRGAYSCSGASVVLMPESPWFRQRMLTMYGATTGAAQPKAEVGARTPATKENYSAFARYATCDAQSRFGFQGLPNGAWYIITVAHASSGAKGEDMAIMRRVETYDGTLSVDL